MTLAIFPVTGPALRFRPTVAISAAMARWLRQILVALLAVALAAGGLVPMATAQPVAQAHRAHDDAADALHRLAMAGADRPSAGVAAVATAPCHGMAMPVQATAMPCETALPSSDQAAPDQPPVPHKAPACPNMMLCCVGAVPAVPATTQGIGAPMTASAVLALVLERAGDGHILSPLPKVPRA